MAGQHLCNFDSFHKNTFVFPICATIKVNIIFKYGFSCVYNSYHCETIKYLILYICR